jgi:hypothetical protein
MFEPPEYLYKKALEKVEHFRLEAELRRQFPKPLWRHLWAEGLRKLADRLEPEPSDFLQKYQHPNISQKT